MVHIRKIQTHAEYERCVDLQKIVWGFSDRELVPSRTMIVAQKHGGCVLGAFAESGELVGFALSFASRHKGCVGQHSSMLAVLHEYRDQNIGWRLKLAQRKDALEREVPVITWTFDPLESKNAHLNLNKLGAVAVSYYENHYPQSASDLYSGLGTDRFLVEWWIAGERVRRRLDEPHKPSPPIATPLDLPSCVNPSHPGPDGLSEPGEPRLDTSALSRLVEIPADINQIKRRRFDLAVAWRENTRRVLRHYLNMGYAATQLLFEESPGPAARRTFYRLEKEPSL